MPQRIGGGEETRLKIVVPTAAIDSGSLNKNSRILKAIEQQYYVVASRARWLQKPPKHVIRLLRAIQTTIQTSQLLYNMDIGWGAVHLSPV
jgi:hypothetical protein